MNKLYVLLDNGHGKNTPGKRSPLLQDGSRLYEWEYCREITAGIKARFENNKNIEVIMITPEEYDVLLGSRVKRINNYCTKFGTKNCIMLSIHINAAGNGGWMNARGWSAWTTRGQNNSDKFADCLYEAAEQIIKSNKEYIDTFKGNQSQKPIRTDFSDGDKDWEAGFQITKGSNCPAVLTENMFMDNKLDVDYLLSASGFNDIINIHVEGIKKYYNKYKQ